MHKSPLNRDSENTSREEISKSKFEKALIASETRYRRLFESAKDGILILDAETGMIVDVNPFLIDLLGYSKENFIQKTIWEIGFFKDIFANKERFFELQQEEYVRYEDLPLKTADGRKINVEFVSNVYLVNNHKVIQCSIRDITERKETEAHLEETRQELAEIKKFTDELNEFTENIIDTVREPLLAIDKDLRVIKASSSFYKFFKVTAGETIGKLIYELGNHQWDIPQLKELLENIIPEKNSFDNYEVEHNFSTIGKRVMQLNARQVKRAFGKEKIILLAIEDITERKGKEDSLNETHRATSEFLNILLDLMYVPIIIWDSSMIINRFNRKFEQLSGYDSAEVIGKRIDFLFPKEKIAATLKLLKNNLDAENLEAAEITILTKDNNNKTVLWNSSPVFDEEGKKIIATISQDITSRKLTEDALSFSETRYRRLFEAAQDGILILDSETGKTVDVNPFLIDLLGYSKKEFIEKPIWEIGSFKVIYENKKKFFELQQKEYVRYDDLPLETANGQNIHAEFVSNVYLGENHKVIQCNIRDITRRKHDAKEITMLARSLKSVNECVSITDLKDIVLFVNESFLKTYGYLENELIGKNISLVRSQHNQAKLVDEILPGTLTGGWQGELWNKRKDGSDFLIYLSTTIIQDNDGHPLGLIGVASDITERKRAEMELIKAKEKAEENDRLKSAFLTNMSHEIRTPMNGILGFTELLRTADLTGEEQQIFIAIIEKSGNRLLNLINDIISISKIETNQTEITFTDVNINLQIEDIFNFFRLEAENKKLNISFKNDLPTNKAVIITDSIKVYSVLSNLVNNAIKFTQTGSIELGYFKKDGFFEFYVKDNGPGIPEEKKEIIFERFRQVSEGLIRNYEGAGLGLSISKAYVEMLGGKIWVENNEGKKGIVSGATFFFTIPAPVIDTDHIKQVGPLDNLTKNETGRLNILIVEDDELSVLLITKMVKEFTQKVLIATSGVEAVEICRKNPEIDLVLMDIQMPEMDGYSATRKIREFNSEVVIIAQTAYALVGDREKSIAAGCNDYVSKPVNRKALILKINKYFD